jgi:hypothetical protein
VLDRDQAADALTEANSSMAAGLGDMLAATALPEGDIAAADGEALVATALPEGDIAAADGEALAATALPEGDIAAADGEALAATALPEGGIAAAEGEALAVSALLDGDSLAVADGVTEKGIRRYSQQTGNIANKPPLSGSSPVIMSIASPCVFTVLDTTMPSSGMPVRPSEGS